jgi:hypothetical protein
MPGFVVWVKRSSRIRYHHLLKTFHSGPGGWTDQQLPDGTIVFTARTGHTYTTEPLDGKPGSPPTTNHHPSEAPAKHRNDHGMLG